MKIKVPCHITREFVKAHPELIFVFSNDHAKHGLEGMAWHFEGEPNTYQVSTCVKKCKNSRYFNDSNDTHWQWIREEISAIPLDGRPIVVVPKIGLGCSRMKELAPKMYKFLIDELNKIKSPDIEFVYGS
jgi:hypothetical protein